MLFKRKQKGVSRKRMQYYTRYIIKTLFAPTCVITFILTGIVLLTQSLRFVDLILNRGLELSTFLYLTLLLIPLFLSVTLPIGIFCSVLHGYYKLIMDSELLVLQGSGLSKLQLAKPALIFASTITLISYGILLYLLPASYREFKDTQAYIKENYASLLLQEGVFNTPLAGLTVYIEEHDDSGLLKGIFVHDNRLKAKPSTMMAQQGLIQQTPAGLQLHLLFGSRQEVNRKQDILSVLYFDKYTIDLSSYTKTNEARWREPRERFLHELFFPQETLKPTLYFQLLAEGHHRLLWPLYNMILTLIAVASLLRKDFNRTSQWQRILFASIIGIFLVSIHIGLNALAANHPWLGVGMYLIAFMGISLGIGSLISYHRRFL